MGDRAAARWSVTLFLCGDVMIGRGVDQLRATHADPRLFEAYVKSAETYIELAERVSGPIPRDVPAEYVWGDALAAIEQRAGDARIANLETALTTSDAAWPAKQVLYRAHPANVALLRAAGLDCVSLANNHVLDWGDAGLAQTVATLDAAGIGHLGAGADAAQAWRPAIVETGTARIVVAGFGSTNSGIPAEWAASEQRAGVAVVDDWSSDAAARVARAVAQVRRPGDLVVVSVHWGSNWGHQLPAAQRRLAHALIDGAGASVVHGHSSHHPRAIEIYRERLILYGCGDFITDYEGITSDEGELYRSELAPAYFCRLAVDTGILEGLTVVPFVSRRLRLERAGREHVEWLAATLDELGQSLATRALPTEDAEIAVVPR